ncbi:N-acetyltransferase [Chitinophaga silvatica]|uniref:N-acetyltransferase n=1 Tax=Chitinophaga silvatica TaxID=2282649 RepID=A0A3E1Y929_9BACT|nr:GNAT family N-acetyltransferase [Chitinophaga silvatica]RFS21912.1 N-acetyltransferase [Chitinophaga silvatica]
MKLYIEPPRLILRDFLNEDWATLHSLYLMPETVRYNPSGYPENEEATRKLVKTWSEQRYSATREAYTAAIIERASNSFIGIISLDLGDSKYAKGEIWYKLLPGFWGKGFATEAMIHMLSFGFYQLNLHRVECGCSVHNIASYKIMEKVGMTREGVKRKVLPLEDGWHDAYIYGILEAEFKYQTA